MINLSERVVKVRLSAQVAEYQAGMLKAAQATRTVGTEAEKLAQKRQAFEQLGRASLTAGGLMAAGIGVAVKKFADFDEAMSNVAATGQDARDSIAALREAAIEAGARTVFSATESANAIEEMAKAGVDAKDVLGGGLSGALDLAAAGGLGVADAAGIAAVALKTFKLEGSDMSHVADLLAAGAGKAMGDVSDLSQALAQGGQVAAATGLSIEETTAALSAFASQGLLGSDAGTSLKTMLQRLTPQSKEAAAQFEALGISAYDSTGQFVGLANFAGQLETAMKDLTPEARNAAMSVMFGSDAVRAANVLYGEGYTGIRQWISAVDDQGYAAETARTRLDNLKGDVEALGGALDSAFITMGSASNGPLRGMVQGLTALVDGFNEMPDGAQEAVFWIGTAGAAALTAGGLYLAAVPKIAEYRVALATLGTTAQTTSRVVGIAAGGLSAALVGASVVVGVLASAQAEARQRAESYAEALKEGTGAVRDLVVENLQAEQSFLWWNKGSAFDAAERFGISISTLTDAVMGNKDAMAELQPLYDAINGDLDAYNALMAQGTGSSVEKQIAMEVLAEVLKEQSAAQEEANRLSEQSSEANDEAAGAAQTHEEALRGLAGQAEDAGEQVEKLADTIKGFGSATLDVRQAQRDFESALDKVQDAVDKNGKSLDITTEKGRDNEAAIDDLAKSALEYAAALYEQTGSQEQAADAIAEGRDQLVDMLGEFGITGKAAEDYADKLGLIPENVETYVSAVTDPAVRAIDAFIRSYNNRSIKIGVSAETIVGNPSMGYKAPGHATGGAIHGPGTGTSDSIPAMLSDGEHVIPADEVQAAGGQSAIYAWRAAMRNGLPGFAGGGAVTKTSAEKAVRDAEAKLRREKAQYEDAKRARDNTRKGTKARTAAEKKLKKEQDDYEDAKKELADAKDDLADINREISSDRADWNTGNRRGENRRAGTTGNGLSLVDDLLAIAERQGGPQGKKLRDEALKAEKAYLKLEKQASAAAEKVEKSSNALEKLRDSAARVKDAVASAVSSFFSLAKIGAVTTSEVEKTRKSQKSMTVDGQTYTWYETETYTEQTTSKPTAKSILADTKAAEARIKTFANKLKQLANRKLSPKLLEEIAMMGVEAGEPIADALLAASDSEIKQLNTSLSNIDKYSQQAGTTVADAGYKELIAAAEKQLEQDQRTAQEIQDELQNQTTRIINTITTALGGTVKKDGSGKKEDPFAGLKKAAGGPVYGPGTATSDSIPARLSNGENVWSAFDVERHGGQAEVERLKRLSPTAARFVAASIGATPQAPVVLSSPSVARPAKEVIQLVVDRRVLAEAIRDHDRSLR